MHFKKIFSLLVLVLTIFSIGIFFYLQQTFQQKVLERIKEFYEITNPDAKVEIISFNQESGLYHVFLKLILPTGIIYREVFVTQDGKYMNEVLINVEKSIEQIQRLKNFNDCLYEKGLRIFGMSNHTASLFQLNILGIYGSKLFIWCDVDLQYCLNLDITQIPSVVYQDRVYPGVYSLQWFSSLTGCEI
jgi:hypothetical protein